MVLPLPCYRYPLPQALQPPWRSPLRRPYRVAGALPFPAAVAQDRAITQAQNLRERLGAPLAIGDWVSRPKGMHKTTYARHLVRLARKEVVVNEHAFALITRLGSRLDGR